MCQNPIKNQMIVMAAEFIGIVKMTELDPSTHFIEILDLREHSFRSLMNCYSYENIFIPR